MSYIVFWKVDFSTELSNVIYVKNYDRRNKSYLKCYFTEEHFPNTLG